MGIGREFFKKKQEGCVWRNLHPRFEGAKNPPTDKTCIDIGSEVSGKIRRFSWRKLRPRFKGENKPSHSRFKGENKRSHRLKSHVPWLWRYMGKGVKGAPRGSCALVFKGEKNSSHRQKSNVHWVGCEQVFDVEWHGKHQLCVCVFVCVCVCVCVCMSCVCRVTWQASTMCVCEREREFVCECVCVSVCASVCGCVCVVCVCVYVE